MSQHVQIAWGYPDGRGPVGSVVDGGRKIVRMDRSVTARPGPSTIQPCRVSHDTAPGVDHRGVLFVVPIGPAVDRETARAAARAEVRAEMEASWRRVSVEALDRLVSGSMHVPYDPRWGGSEPKWPRLRVVGGRAQVWASWYGPGRELVWGECLFDLPELGEREELRRRLVAAWTPLTPRDAACRWAALDLGPLELERTVIETAQRLAVQWVECRTGAVYAESVVCLPGDPDLGGETVPEVDACYQRWAAGTLAETDATPREGVVTLTHGTTETYTYVSPDERGLRGGGGDRYVSVAVDGVIVGHVFTAHWGEVGHVTGLVAGQRGSVSQRQLVAIHHAYADMWVTGPLGPLGRAAMLRAGGVL